MGNEGFLECALLARAGDTNLLGLYGGIEADMDKVHDTITGGRAPACSYPASSKI
jgi:hypothetical protein